MADERNNIDNTNDSIKGKMDEYQKKAVKKGAETGKKALRKVNKKAVKLGKKAVKKGAKIIVKAVLATIKTLIALLGPWGIGILIVIFLGAISFDFIFESRGKEQGYQAETTEEDNTIERNDAGDYVATNLSSGNKKIKAFYTILSEKSYYKMIGDDPKPYSIDDTKSDKGLDLTKVKDKYDREKMFYLNPNALWTLDEFLNNNKFRYPEQFLKPVAYNPDTLELKPLTDSNDKLTVESTYYDPSTNLPTDKKVPGVWDYGFASVLHYVELKEQKEIRGKFVREEYWDPDEQKIKERPMEEQQIKIRDLIPPVDKTYPVDGFPKTIYMIDKVISPAGTMSNTIIQEEVMGDEVKKEEIYDTKTVDIYDWVDVEVEKEREVTKTTTVLKTRTVEKEEKYQTTCKLAFISFPCTKTRTIEVEEPYYDDVDYTTTEKYTETEKQWKVVEKRTIELRRFFEGNYFETIPRYEGNPDTSMITGNKYFNDYFLNYVSYVPPTVMGRFDFKARTGKDEEEIDKILEDAEINENSGVGQEGASGGTTNLGNFQMGSGASSQSYKNAMQYLPYFQKWGKTYGIDPFLLIAKASQESGGNHEKYITSDRCSVAGCGLMQIEMPGKVMTSATAFNFDTKSMDTMQITGIDSVRTVDDNIRAGAMIYASRVADYKYNVLLSIQAYNYGPGGAGAMLGLYSKETGKSKDQIIADVGDTGWMKWRNEVHEHPGNYFSWSGGTYGDPQYVEHVLQYYKSLEGNSMPYVVKPDGTKVEADGKLQAGFVANMTMSGEGWFNGFTSWIRAKAEEIKANWKKLFPDRPDTYPPDRIRYENIIDENKTKDIINMMFVMEEKKYLSEYDDMTDEEWKKRFVALFTNPMGAYWQPDQSINVMDYFPKGITSPVSISEPQITKGFGMADNGGSTEFHGGVDIVSPLGTEILAVSDGEVIKVDSIGSDSSLGKNIEIRHSASVTTVYGNLNSVNVKNGDKVTKGQKIGTSGNSGRESGYVLHFELIKDGKQIDGSWVVTGQGVNQVASGPMSIEGSEKAKEAYKIMSQYIGSWYAWGGTTPPVKDANGNWAKPIGTGNFVAGEETTNPGFDCSGLIYYAYRQPSVGIMDIPRTSQEQQKYAKAVSKEDVQPGDLLFWGKPAYHVAVYIGNDEYIHSPQTGKTITVAKVNWSKVTSIGRVLP